MSTAAARHDALIARRLMGACAALIVGAKVFGLKGFPPGVSAWTPPKSNLLDRGDWSAYCESRADKCSW